MPADQNEMKRAAAVAALEWVKDDTVIGVGTGSTANFFIDALAESNIRVDGAVASSEATAERLKAAGIDLHDLNASGPLSVYIDGADEANPQLHLIKGGGGALTREKIVAAASSEFLCIADASKKVDMLGNFPLPVEVDVHNMSIVNPIELERQLNQLAGVVTCGLFAQRPADVLLLGNSDGSVEKIVR